MVIFRERFIRYQYYRAQVILKNLGKLYEFKLLDDSIELRV